MHDARARLAGWMNACDRPASQRAHGWLAGWRILTEDYIPMHERPGSRARMLKVVGERLAVMGGSCPPPLAADLIPLSCIFADFGFEPPYLPIDVWVKTP